MITKSEVIKFVETGECSKEFRHELETNSRLREAVEQYFKDDQLAQLLTEAFQTDDINAELT